jgi:hypothetical protein
MGERGLVSHLSLGLHVDVQDLVLQFKRLLLRYFGLHSDVRYGQRRLVVCHDLVFKFHLLLLRFESMMIEVNNRRLWRS